MVLRKVICFQARRSGFYYVRIFAKQGVVPTSEGVIPTSEGVFKTKQAIFGPYFARMRTLQHEKARFLAHKNPLFASLALFSLYPSIYTPSERRPARENRCDIVDLPCWRLGISESVLWAWDSLYWLTMAKKKKQSDAGKPASKRTASKPTQKRTARIDNRKARHDYHIEEKVECGIALTGTEVKSLRAGLMKIDEAYARIDQGEVFLVGSNIAPYVHAASEMQHEPKRKRKLLLKRKQIHQLEIYTRQNGMTLIPLSVFFKKGWAKLDLGVAVGKRDYDKRDSLKKKQQQRDMDRAMKR
jgi:SsrA-binding protein